MDAEYTVVRFSTYLKDLDSKRGGRAFYLSKACAVGAIKLLLDISLPSHTTLNEWLPIGLSSLSSQCQHKSHVVAALSLFL